MLGFDYFRDMETMFLTTQTAQQGQKGASMAQVKSTSLFSFGAFSRFHAVRFDTRFGTTEWHVFDAEMVDPKCPDLPALVRQFDSVRELTAFVDNAIAEARREGADIVTGICTDDLDSRVTDKIGQDWRVDMVDVSRGVAGVHDQIHHGERGYTEMPIDQLRVWR